MSSYQGGIITKNPITPTGPNYNGVAPGIWTLDQAAYWQRQGLWPTQGVGIPDTYFPYVSYLMSTTATNAQQNNTFLDSSTNNFTITRNGNTTQGSFSPYGSNWSNYFDGSGDYLTLPSGSGFAFGTGDFTVECWVYSSNASSTSYVIVDARNSGQTGTWVLFRNSNNQIEWYNGSSSYLTSTNIPANQWNHVAYSRSGTTGRVLLNGAVVGTFTDATNYSVSPTTSYIGCRYSVGEFFNGYISNFRTVKGTALYTGSYTVPTAPLTAITNTSLLTCQSNRFRDASTNNFTITRVGNTSVTEFSPFSPSSPGYVAATSGGSISFDGATDWLNMGGEAAFAYGTGAFTIECWFYALGLGQMIIDGRPPSTNGNYVLVAVGGGGTLEYYSNNVGSVLGNTQIQLGAWNHFAIARSGTTTKMFLNGIQNASFSDNTNYEAAANRPIIGTNGYRTDLSHFNGYMANFRIVKGTAVYTANFTPPTSPVTAISGTSLLLNATNAGIFDAATINNMETVGNAQVSTAVSKFGGSSVAFDGTGDYLTSNAPNDLYAFGTGDFTIEMWVNLSSFASLQILYDSRPASTDGLYPLIYVSSGGGSIIWQISATARITGTATLSTGTWYHVAVSRASGSTKMFLNGTQVGSTYADTNAYLNSGTTRPFIGGSSYSAGTLTVNGYLDDLRITKGVARYTTTFTPPTQAFPPY